MVPKTWSVLSHVGKGKNGSKIYINPRKRTSPVSKNGKNRVSIHMDDDVFIASYLYSNLIKTKELNEFGFLFLESKSKSML